MPNPFVQRPGMFGVQPVSAGVRSHPLPLFPHVQHWWDAADPDRVWEDFLMTIPASDGSLLRAIEDKGFAGSDLAENSVNVPSYFEQVVNGLAVARATSALTNLNAAVTGSVGSDDGESFLIVGRKVSGADGTVNVANIGNADVSGAQMVTPGGGWRVKLPGFPTFVDTNRIVVDTEWNWVYGTVNLLGDWRIQSSGEAEVTGNTAYSARTNTNFALFCDALNSSVHEVSEFIVWDIDHTIIEQAQAITYVDNKYGVMPF